MRVIVTGGAGFIGSCLAELLVEKGHETIILDDLSTGRLDKFPNSFRAQADFCAVDIRERERLDKLFEKTIKRADCLIHLAATASIVPSIKNPWLYHDVNVTGTVNLLELARKHNIPKFIYAASGSCYGLPREIPTSENCSVRPMYPYALTKYLGEQYAFSWAKYYGLEVISLRLFNVFGPKMCLTGGYGGLFSTILPQIFNNRPVITIGDGGQRRDFVYVTDAARAFLAAMEPDTGGEVFNIGRGASVSVNEILDLLGVSDDRVRRLADRPGEPRETLADIRKATQLLKWQPETDFKDGLILTIKDVEYWKEAKVWTWEESVEAQKEWYQYLGHKTE